jgi:hypothetical protein
MTASFARRAMVFALIAVSALPLAGAAFESCDGVPVRPIVKPIVLRPNGCSFKDLGSPEGRSIGILSREGAVHWTTLVLTPNVADPCIVTHDDGTWDVALVDPGVIDGLAGRTVQLYDGCPDSKTHEADILIAVDNNFQEGDQRRFITNRSTAGGGRVAALHEYGHALGLEHSDAEFAVMRGSLSSGAALGGSNSSGSPHYFFADDAFGLLQIGGLPKDVPNFYVSAQALLGNGALRNADTDPGTGAAYPNPLPVRTRQLLSFSAGAGSHNWWSHAAILRAYADTGTVCTSLPGVGTSLGFVTVPTAAYTSAAGVFTVSIPPLGPSGQVLTVHVAGTQLKGPYEKSEARGWDDCATTGLRIVAP